MSRPFEACVPSCTSRVSPEPYSRWTAQTRVSNCRHTSPASVVLPGKGGYQGTFLCPNGITATPVADTATGILYVIAPNGPLYGLDLGGGNVRYGPVQFVAPFSKNWSLNLVDGTIHTVLAQGCGGGISGFYWWTCGIRIIP